MRKRRYWYRLHYSECVLCGRDKSWRERVYGRKPGRIKRYVYDAPWACYSHFI